MNAPANLVPARRRFLQGMAAILAAGVAPAAIGSGILMPIRPLWKPPEMIYFPPRIYCMGWTISNQGGADIVLDGLQDGAHYYDAGSVIIRPGETLAYNTETRVFTKTFALGQNES